MKTLFIVIFACALMVPGVAFGNTGLVAHYNLLNLLSITAHAQTQLRDYAGVPHPAYPNPVLTENAGFEPFPYDPYTIEAPRPAAWPDAEQAGAYFIDPTDPNASDEVAYGSPNIPRKTLPSLLNLEAGTYIEIAGGVFAAPIGIEAKGTAANPIWIRGSSSTRRPTFYGSSIRLEGSRYLILENILWDGNNQSNSVLGTNHNGTRGDTEYVVIRNVEITNLDFIGGGGAAINIGSSNLNGGTKTRYIVIDNVHIHDNGQNVDWQTGDPDQGGVAISTRQATVDNRNETAFIWVTGSTFARISGSGVMVTSPESVVAGADYRDLVHHIWVAGNVAHSNRQSGFWSKRGSHVIFSNNRVHNVKSYGGGNDCCMGTQYGPDMLWFIGNECYDSNQGFKRSSTIAASDAEAGRHYFIGNLIYGIHDRENQNETALFKKGGAFEFWQGAAFTFVVDNTMYDVEAGVRALLHGGAGDLYVVGNLVMNVNDPYPPIELGAFVDLGRWSDAQRGHAHHNMGYNADGYDKWIMQRNTQDANAVEANARDRVSGNISDVDPLFINPNSDPNNRNFNLQPTSPARDNNIHTFGKDGVELGVLPEVIDVYQMYEDAYGVNIRYDFKKEARDVLVDKDIGAFEYKATNSNTEKAWHYTGIPYTDWAYDPFTLPAPTAPVAWPAAEQPGYYFIAPDDPHATDQVDANDTRDANNRRYGYPDRPRKTLPMVSNNGTAIAPGSVFWLKGGNWNNHYSAFTSWQAQFTGAPDNPIWIYGDPTTPPVFSDLRIQFSGTKDQYVIVDGIVWDAWTTRANSSVSVADGAHHITVRNCTVRNRVYATSGSHFNVTGKTLDAHDVVFYNIDFYDNGHGSLWGINDDDYHAFKANGDWGGGRAYRIWAVENTCRATTQDASNNNYYKSVNGTFFQVGDQLVTTGNVDHVFIAGNQVDYVRQALVGCKRSADVIVSGNIGTQHNRVGASGNAFNTKYDRQEYLWFIGNYIENWGALFRRNELTAGGAGGPDTESPDESFIYVIGNIGKNMTWNEQSGGIGQWKEQGITFHDMRGTVYVVNNVMDNTVYGVVTAQNSRIDASSNIHIYNNIFTNMNASIDPNGGHEIMISTASGEGSDLKVYMENNLMDKMKIYLHGQGTYATPATLNALPFAAGNLIENPQFVEPNNGDYRMQSDSPAIDAGTLNYATNPAVDVYQQFVDRYSNDPDFPGNPADVWPQDFQRQARVIGGAVDIGAYEQQQSDPPPPSANDFKDRLGLTGNEVITLGGDSITAAKMYVHYLMAWLQLAYPELDLKTYSLARSGSSISGWSTPDTTAPIGNAEGLYERYHYPFSSDIVFMMHGHNGGHGPLTHRGHYEDLWNVWVDGIDAAKLVILGMHPTQNDNDNKYAEAKADEEALFAATDPNIFHADTFDHLGTAWLANFDNAIDVQQMDAQPFNGTDTVHPGPAGHIVIAWAVLQGLGVETLVSAATIDASTGAVSNANQCSISNVHVTPSSATFDRLDERLPWAIDEVGRANAIALMPAINQWQQYTLTIANLEPGAYTIAIDGVAVATASHTELGNGINLADMTSGPVWAQCQEVLAEIRELQGSDRITGDGLPGNANTGTIGDVFDYTSVHYVRGDQRGATYKASMANVISNLAPYMAELHADAQPLTRTWTAQPQQSRPNAPSNLRIE